MTTVKDLPIRHLAGGAAAEWLRKVDQAGNNDGRIGVAEIDAFLTDPTAVAPQQSSALRQRLLDIAASQPVVFTHLHPMLALGGTELRAVFSGTGVLAPGSTDLAGVVAVQRALMHLAHPEVRVVDGVFGRGETFPAVRAFQGDHGLTQTGLVDRQTLMAMHRALTARDAMLAARPLPPLSPITESGDSWVAPGVQAAWGQFAGERWQQLKQIGIEADCKALALKLMVDFLDYFEQQTGTRLPYPGTSRGIVERAPHVHGPENSRGWSDAVPETTERVDYRLHRRLQAVDGAPSLIAHDNYVFNTMNAKQLARLAVEPVPTRDGLPMVINHPLEMDAAMRRKVPEVRVSGLVPGDIISIDHRDGGASFDHTVVVVGVERGEDEKVRRVTLANGSFDDLRDHTSQTPPVYPLVNFYSEEIVVEFDAEGKIVDSTVTWSSEPPHIKPRYNAIKTLMELSEGGALQIGRWRD